MDEKSSVSDSSLPQSSPSDPSISEEFHNWSVNASLLYDSVVSYHLEWPSLTVQCLPAGAFPDGLPKQKSLKRNKKYVEDEEEDENIMYQYVLIGTHTSEGEPNYLQMMRMSLPSSTDVVTEKIFSERKDYYGFSFGNENCRKFDIEARYSHEGEINRARYLPQDYRKIATKSISGDVLLYSINERTLSESIEEGYVLGEDLRLTGHTKEGFGLAWNPLASGRLASTATDGFLCVWDIQMSQDSKYMKPLMKIESHSSSANDVAWSEEKENLLFTCGDDGKIKMWDLRLKNRFQDFLLHFPRGIDKLSFIPASSLPINTISPFPKNGHIVASGGEDTTIKLWDIRQLSHFLQNLESHEKPVQSLLFSNSLDGFIISSSLDRFVNIWDIHRSGMEQSEEDQKIGPPELIFSHGGHCAPLSDIAWNPSGPLELCITSVSEDNILQCWQPNTALLRSDEESMQDEKEETSSEDVE
ncbi:RbAp48 [Cardiosporidium cionae]|uniref:RbAp48 n=1 Tax=Cardiosporidium cionae TaxID=476202 RepID=A0ABQ7JAY4_9APIC|nr:RbAp48 [Cardiosporidium cionae]|eukprot:KAF8821152.1 RbAp48 [Cardiosporidium cionae]